MQRILAQTILLALLCAIDCHAGESGFIAGFELRQLCNQPAEVCEKPTESIHQEDGYSHGFPLQRIPVFVTHNATYWSECTQLHRPGVCLTLNGEDLEKVKAALGEFLHKTVVVVVYGKIVSMIIVGGIPSNPVFIGQPDGVSPPADLVKFLKPQSATRKSSGPVDASGD